MKGSFPIFFILSTTNDIKYVYGVFYTGI